MPGTRLGLADRAVIAAGLDDGDGFAEIGRKLGRPASTIMREVNRNGGPADYRAASAHQAARERSRRGPDPAFTTPSSHRGRDRAAVHAFALTFAALLVQQGMPRIAAGVLSLLYIDDDGSLSAGQLAQRLKVSAASISNAVRFLESQGLVRRHRTPGTRREQYRVDDSIWRRSLESVIATNDSLIGAAVEGSRTLGPTTAAGIRFVRHAELLTIVNDSIRDGIVRWRERTVQAPPP